jgi:hypothetical protein
VPHHLPEDAEKLLQGRVQIINVWRPIKTVQRDPLAVAEAHSVDDASLQVVELIYPNRRGETYAVKHDAGHRYDPTPTIPPLSLTIADGFTNQNCLRKK